MKQLPVVRIAKAREKSKIIQAMQLLHQRPGPLEQAALARAHAYEMAQDHGLSHEAEAIKQDLMAALGVILHHTSSRTQLHAELINDLLQK